MTGEKRWYKIPLLTKWFEIRFYLYWRGGKFWRMGFDRHHGCKMTFEEAIMRLERKRIRREHLTK
jgi:hypothetical protein